jgi:hypothetical protein
MLRLLKIGALGRAPLIVFQIRDTFVEGEGLLDLLKSLDDGFEADSVYLFNSVEAFVQARKLSANFAQFRRQKILQYLEDIFDNANGNLCS